MDASYPHYETPSQFALWLFGRLREISHISWDEDTRPTHSSYGDWHVWGTLHNPDHQPPLVRTPGSPGHRHTSFGSRPSTPSRTSSDGKSDFQLADVPVLARISCHTVTLERQYQMATNQVLESDPSGKHHVRALQLLRLHGYHDEPSLSVIIYDRPGPNYLRDLIHCGPNFYKATEEAMQNRWSPQVTASGHFESGNIRLCTFLPFAIGAAKCCEMLHQGNRLVHGEIRGDSFHFHQDTKEVKLLNLGSGVRSFEHYLTSSGWSFLTRQPGVDYKLQFLAPEQTGRSQYGADARTDIYSLGILFWNTLTGQLPFTGSSPLEVIRNALSRRVAPVSSKRLDVPDALSAVIQKMVSKNMEERYHSASGLRHDLEEIEMLLSNGDSDALRDYQVGKRDVNSFFALPNLQLGRQEDRQKILRAIDRVSKVKQSHSMARNLPISNRSDSSHSDARFDGTIHSGEAGSDAASIHSRASGAHSVGMSDSRADGRGSPTASFSADKDEHTNSDGTGLLQHTLQKRVSHDYTPSLASGEGNPGSSSYLSLPEGQETIFKQNARFKRKGRCDVIAVHGSPGLGKSSLLQSVHTEARNRGHVATAKFDQVRSCPFDPPLKLLSSVMRQIFSESEVNTSFHCGLRALVKPVWGKLHNILHLPEGILDIVQCAPPTQAKHLPNVAENPENVQSYQPCSAKNSMDFIRNGTSTNKSMRFMAIYLDVLRYITSHRFVLFCFEDTEFVDEESSELMRALIASRMEMVLAFALPERGKINRRVRVLLDQNPCNFTEIELKPLSEDQVVEYVSAALRRSREYVFPLVAVVYEKTGGNPFFMREMLENCYRSHCVWYSWKESAWKFDLDKVFAEFESENYGSQINNNHLVKRLSNLPPNVRSLLAYASLLGAVFRFSMVKNLMEANSLLPRHDSRPRLERHDSESLRPQKATGKVAFVRQSSQDAVRALQGAIAAYVIEAEEGDDLFRFCHDRFQHGATALCHNPEEMHYRIAKLMVERDEENSFYIRAAHICASVQIIRQKEPDRKAYRDVLYQAAERAIESGGQAAGSEYLINCLILLQKHPWDESYPDVSYRETLNLYNKAADAYGHAGKPEASLELAEKILKHAKTTLDRVPAYLIKAQNIARRGDMPAAFSVLKTCLAELGLTIGENSWEECDEMFSELCTELEAMDKQHLLDRPASEDATTQALCAVLVEASAAAFWSEPLVFYQLAMIQFKTLLSRGNVPQAGLMTVHLAAVALGKFNRIELGTALGRLADQYFAVFKTAEYFVGRGQTLAALLVEHIQMPLSHCIPRLEQSLAISLSAGDKFAALLNVGLTAAMKIWCSHDMNEVENYGQYAAEEISHWQEDIRGGVFMVSTRQYARALQGKTNTAIPSEIFNDAEHNSQAYLDFISSRTKRPQRAFTIYHNWKVQALYAFEHHDECITVGERILENIAGYWSSRFVVAIPFYVCLSYIGLLRKEPDRFNQKDVIQKIEAHRQRLALWSSSCETNYGAWNLILTAEMHEFQGRIPNALKSFEAALDLAEVCSMHFEFALASELFADFLIRRCAKRPARHAIMDAIGVYNSMSAFAKARNVSEKHEWLLTGTSSLSTVDAGCQTSIEPGPRDLQDESHQRSHVAEVPVLPGSKYDESVGMGPESVGLDILDLTSILKSSQILSSEMQMDKLLGKLTQVILDTTGAELCAIVVEDPEIGMNVGSIVDSLGNEYPSGQPLDETDSVVGKQIVLNCMRFKETVLLQNVFDDERFSNVPSSYREKNPDGRAIIAMPLFGVNNFNLGVIYLEGPPHSFTERNTMVLKLLVNSISISITNAMLYKKAEKASASNAVMVESQKAAVSQARESEQKAKAAEAEAMHNARLKEEAAKAKSMFLANVSHELRTPLNGVIGMSELLKQSQLTQEQESYADSIKICGDLLLSTINEILDYNKLEAGKMQLLTIPLNLRETIEEVTRALSYSNMDKQLETTVQLDLPSEPVIGDPVRLHQILMNLISNAYKFTKQGKITVTSTIDWENEKELEITCAVSDTGIGISDEQKKKLFLPFSQADSSTARSYGGTGLGLSICKAIIQDVMKGKIWLDSTYGQGTTVYFTVKFARALGSSEEDRDGMRANLKSTEDNDDSLPIQLRNRDNSSGSQKHSPLDDTTLKLVPRDKIRVCIAEDNLVNQKIALKFVRNIGFQCEAYGDGRQAVDALERSSKDGDPFHIVLMDVQMPVLDGYRASQAIRKHPDPLVKNVLVIAMTASAIKGDRTKCLEAGMNNYLAKPVRQQVLRDMLEGYVNKDPKTIPSVDREDSTGAGHAKSKKACEATKNGRVDGAENESPGGTA